MGLRQEFITYKEVYSRLQENREHYLYLIKLSAKFSGITSVDTLLDKLDSEATELRNSLNNLKKQNKIVSAKSPRIVLGSIIEDEGINLGDLAEQLGVSDIEIEGAIEKNWDNPVMIKIFKHFGLPLKPFLCFVVGNHMTFGELR
ncbi:hypothetical protein AAXB25_33565 [Paenibacillus lautus]|uniref:hypothetical protein n=1 Tax=Paenibacillus lautus TaxID=1401 RepID=UPI003D2BE7CA